MRAELLRVGLPSCRGLLTQQRCVPRLVLQRPWGGLGLLMGTGGQPGPFQGPWPHGGLRATAQLGCRRRWWWAPWGDAGIARTITPISISQNHRI